MSLEEEGPLTWLWRGVKIKEFSKTRDRILSHWCINSPTFSYLDKEWYLQCEIFLHNITLSLHAKDLSTPPLSLLVSVQLWGGNFAESDCGKINQSQYQKEVDGYSVCVIWERRLKDLDKFFEKFSRNRFLTFRIQFTMLDPQMGLNRASPLLPKPLDSCPQIEPHSKTFVDVSVQTNVTANSTSSLDSSSKAISKTFYMDLNPNVELHCDGSTTKAHTALLSIRSPVLTKMLQKEMVERKTRVVNIRNMRAETFRFFLKYLYTGKLEQEALTFDLALHLYEAADMYEVKRLSKLCAQFLFQKLTVDNACDALVVAAGHSDSDLEGKVSTYVLENEIPLSDDLWSKFPKLASKVYKKNMMMSKLSQLGQPRQKISLEGFFKNSIENFSFLFVNFVL